MFLSQRLEWLFWTYSSQNLLKFKVYEGHYASAKYCDGTFNTGKISIKQTNKKEVGILVILYGCFSYQINMY